MIEQGRLSLADDLKLIESEETVLVRTAAARSEEEWNESLMDVVSGVAPPRWTEQRWAYDEAIFQSFSRRGPEVAGWLGAGEITLHDVVIKLPTVSGCQTSQWCRYASCSTSAGLETLQWPFTSYQLAPASHRPVHSFITFRPPSSV